ncbi:unnamed protein product [Microthlaspi erraticum]|uniref:Cystatin domain-containing protein n=1 Tax=Microthlaspi erraticum TaxID=1685480 RepID=A0A6D2K5L8_9BRAS|nr:unnamed protein product [Microthlaspi erraticum]
MEASIMLEDASEPMEVSSPVVVRTELEPEEEEESDGEIEQGSDEKPKTDDPEDEILEILQAPEWDVDSFDGLEYYSSAEEELSSPLSDEDVAVEHYNMDKRQLINSKDPKLEFVEVVRGNYRGGRKSKSYITFMAREKPDGPVVEYQAKAMVTLDLKRHLILCRPAPMPKPI